MAGRLRVAMVGRYPLEEGRPVGGVESAAEVIADGLAETGDIDMHCVTLASSLRRPTMRRSSAGVTVHLLPRSDRFCVSTGYFLDKRRLRKAVAAIDPDIVHVQTAAGQYAQAVLERGRPSLLSIHGLFFREIPFEPRGRALPARLAAWYERSALRRAKHISCLNNYTLASLSPLTNGAEFRFIDNPIDDSFFGVESREESGRVLMLSIYRRLKGHEYLLRAIEMLVSEGLKVTLYCVGPAADDGYHRELTELVASKRLEENVVLAGNASRSDVLEHYSRCSVVVLPSLVENAPLVISEGMAAGKAIVATSVGGVPEMIEDGRTGLVVPPSDSKALADAIRRLLMDSDLRLLLGTQAKVVAESRFRTEAVVEKTHRFYRDILGETHS